MPLRFHCDVCDKILEDKEPRITFIVQASNPNSAYGHSDDDFNKVQNRIACSVDCVERAAKEKPYGYRLIGPKVAIVAVSGSTQGSDAQST